MGRRERHRLKLTFCFAVVAMGVAGCSVDATGDADPHEDEEAAATAIRAELEAYLSDWNAGDSASLARHFDESYDWMNPVGMFLTGSAAAASFLSASHAAQDSMGIERSLTLEMNALRLLTPEVALVDLSYTQVGPRAAPPPGTARSFIVFVRRDGRWLRAAQRNFRLVQVP